MSEEIPNRRTTDHIPADLNNFVHTTEARGRRIFTGALLSLSIIALTTGAALIGIASTVHSNKELATKAFVKASRSQIEIALTKEKVCSESSNREVTCPALFERLANSLSDEQRVRLACEVILHLKGKEAKTLQKQNPQCKESIP